MKEKYFWKFSKKHVALYLVLLLIPIIITGIVLIVANQTKATIDFEVCISICMGILTYFGSTLLGIIVYYNLWLTEYRKKSIKYNLLPVFNMGKNVVNFFYEDDVLSENPGFMYRLQYNEYYDFKIKHRFVAFSLVNHNDSYPLNFQLDKVEFCKNDKIIDCSDNVRIISKYSITDALDYKFKNKIFVGINDSIASEIMENVDNWLNFSLKFYVKLSNASGLHKCLMLTLQGNELHEKYISNRKYEKLTNKKLIFANIMMTKDFLSKDFE